MNAFSVSPSGCTFLLASGKADYSQDVAERPPEFQVQQALQKAGFSFPSVPAKVPGRALLARLRSPEPLSLSPVRDGDSSSD